MELLLEAWESAELSADWSAVLCANAGAEPPMASRTTLTPSAMSRDLISLLLSISGLHLKRARCAPAGRKELARPIERRRTVHDPRRVGRVKGRAERAS